MEIKNALLKSLLVLITICFLWDEGNIFSLPMSILYIDELIHSRNVGSLLYCTGLFFLVFSLISIKKYQNLRLCLICCLPFFLFANFIYGYNHPKNTVLLISTMLWLIGYFAILRKLSRVGGKAIFCRRVSCT